MSAKGEQTKLHEHLAKLTVCMQSAGFQVIYSVLDCKL